MPAIPPSHLIQAILDGINESGRSAILASSPTRHPRKFIITELDGHQASVWVYAWTLTFGGRPQLPDEYRIQLTTVKSPLDLNPNGFTVLIGFEPNLKMFAGFDLQRHRSFTTGSPSVQIDIRVLREGALQNGFSFDRKGNDEIAVGIRPDQLVNYIYNAEELHRLGRQTQTFGALTKATEVKEISVEDISNLNQERRRIVQTVNRLSRQANFRLQVLQAYGYRCAVTRIQLRLIEAAHVLPIGVTGSIDDVRNGIALSPTYHRAYDNGLIFLDQNMKMQINPEKESLLTQTNLDGGINDFKSRLGQIYLPPDKRQWPHPAFIKKANSFRQIKV